MSEVLETIKQIVDILRTTDVGQTYYSLFAGERKCAMGVLACKHKELLLEKQYTLDSFKWNNTIQFEDIIDTYNEELTTLELPISVTWLNKVNNPNYISQIDIANLIVGLNDGQRLTFLEIADFLEETFKGYDDI